MASFVAASPLLVSFGDKLAASATFDALFRDGMSLVEETAAYLDGDGRDASRHLARTAALAYASESMRLTTRLMQIASWLLLQRAINEGEMSPGEAQADKARTRAGWATTTPMPDMALLPDALLALIEASMVLQGRIQRLDVLQREPAQRGTTPNALDAERALLQRAFAS